MNLRFAKNTAKILALLLLAGASWSLSSRIANAAILSYVTDLITTSAPSVGADHTMRLRLTNAIPAGGKLRILFDSEDFILPAGLGYEDIDLGTSPGFNGPFAERTLSALPGISEDGVSVTSGARGEIVFDLASASGIPAGTYLRIAIGWNAQSGSAGDTQLVNPLLVGSYHIRFQTKDSLGDLIDEGSTLIAIVSPVSMISDTKDYDAPIRSNGLPSSTVPAGIRNIEISLNTDEAATCRFATSSGISYAFMTNQFEQTLSTLHTKVIGGFQDGTTYNFYVRCIDFVPNANSDDYVITVVIENPLPPPATGGGGGEGGFGQAYPSLPGSAEIILSGRSYPYSTVVVLKDNATFREVTVGADGNFTISSSDIGQGTFTFSLYARDGTGKRSSSYSTTLTIVSATRNVVSNIIIPPTIGLNETTVSPGATTTISGKSIASSTVEVWISPQRRGTLRDQDISKFTTRSNLQGNWTLQASTKGFQTDIYEVRARSVITPSNTSGFSQAVLLGVGKEPALDACGKADINRDGKVNLVDFSIMLFNWNTSNPESDINNDGKVNLVDFSIMLFCWTG